MLFGGRWNKNGTNTGVGSFDRAHFCRFCASLFIRFRPKLSPEQSRSE